MMAGGQVGLRFAQDLHKRVQLEANLSAIQTVGEGGVKARKRGWFFKGDRHRADFLPFVHFDTCDLYRV